MALITFDFSGPQARVFVENPAERSEARMYIARHASLMRGVRDDRLTKRWKLYLAIYIYTRGVMPPEAEFKPWTRRAQQAPV